MCCVCDEGQSSCHHMWSLLDADQEIPWTDEPLVMHHKYRCTEDAIITHTTALKHTYSVSTESAANLH